MIQGIILNAGGTIETYFVGRRPASCSVAVFRGDGTEVVGGASCDIDACQTALTADVLAGDDEFEVDDASAIVVGRRRRYLVGDEEVAVKKVAGSVVTLWAPLELDHVAAEPFLGQRVSYVVGSGAAAETWWDGQAVFTPDSGDAQTEVVECWKRKIPDLLCSQIDTRKLVPKEVKAVSAELDMIGALQDARDNMIIDLGGKYRAMSIIGTDHFRRLAAHRFWLDREFEFGSEWADVLDRLRKEYERLMGLIVDQAGPDAELQPLADPVVTPRATSSTSRGYSSRGGTSPFLGRAAFTGD